MMHIKCMRPDKKGCKQLNYVDLYQLVWYSFDYLILAFDYLIKNSEIFKDISIVPVDRMKPEKTILYVLPFPTR